MNLNNLKQIYYNTFFLNEITLFYLPLLLIIIKLYLLSKFIKYINK